MKVRSCTIHSSDSENVFHIGPSDAHLGSALAECIIQQGWKQASVITEQRGSLTQVTDANNSVNNL